MNGDKIEIGTECPGCQKRFKTPWAAWGHVVRVHPLLKDRYFYPTSKFGHKGKGPEIGRPRKDPNVKRVKREPVVKLEAEPAAAGPDPVMPLNYCPCCGTNLAVIATVLSAAGKVVAHG